MQISASVDKVSLSHDQQNVSEVTCFCVGFLWYGNLQESFVLCGVKVSIC